MKHGKTDRNTPDGWHCTPYGRELPATLPLSSSQRVLLAREVAPLLRKEFKKHLVSLRVIDDGAIMVRFKLGTPVTIWQDFGYVLNHQLAYAADNRGWGIWIGRN